MKGKYEIRDRASRKAPTKPRRVRNPAIDVALKEAWARQQPKRNERGE